MSRRAEEPSAVASPPKPPQPKFIRPDELEAFFSHEAAFHRADWQGIGKWLEANVSPVDLDVAYSEAALLWVTKLREDLGGEYFILQSPQTILLSDQSLEKARWMLHYAGQVADKIKEYLGQTAWVGGFGRDVILLFSDQDDYYQYLSHHSPDGEQAASGGVCIHSGYTHVAMPWPGQLEIAANTIVHELTHDCLSHLPLPLWLNEGIAVTVQKAIAPAEYGATQSDHSKLSSAFMSWRPPLMWDELAERHFAFWTEETIQSFWAGTSFFIPGDSNELSYSLAEVFVKLICDRSTAATFQTVLQSAHQNDAGQTAMLDLLDLDLGDVAGTFLGEGNWRPLRKAMVECWKDAGWSEWNVRLMPPFS